MTTYLVFYNAPPGCRDIVHYRASEYAQTDPTDPTPEESALAAAREDFERRCETSPHLQPTLGLLVDEYSATVTSSRVSTNATPTKE